MSGPDMAAYHSLHAHETAGSGGGSSAANLPVADGKSGMMHAKPNEGIIANNLGGSVDQNASLVAKPMETMLDNATIEAQGLTGIMQHEYHESTMENMLAPFDNGVMCHVNLKGVGGELHIEKGASIGAELQHISAFGAAEVRDPSFPGPIGRQGGG